jgi:arginine repressor
MSNTPDQNNYNSMGEWTRPMTFPELVAVIHKDMNDYFNSKVSEMVNEFGTNAIRKAKGSWNYLMKLRDERLKYEKRREHAKPKQRKSKRRF